MEDTTSLSIFGMLIVCSAWLGYITYEPIKRWAWSDVEQKEKTHCNGSL
ncbi:hypothetical protein [Bacillus sp. CDB3]|nr:hypothetical protein [Bacillus sp. CDB3]